MTAVALISDLMMRSQVASAAERAGTRIEIVSTTEALLTILDDQQPQLVIIDLSHPGLNVTEMLPSLKDRLPAGARTLAFGPHVHTSLLAAAREAGCDEVISRGQFHARMEQLLRLKAQGAREKDEGL